MQKTFYKVVRSIPSESNTKLVSCQMNYKGMGVNYIVGKFVKPRVKHSRLFVFDNKIDAKIFCGYDCDVYECHIKGKTTTMKYRCTTLDAVLTDVISFWKNKFQHKKQIADTNFCVPKGTVLVDEVKLIKKVSK